MRLAITHPKAKVEPYAKQLADMLQSKSDCKARASVLSQYENTPVTTSTLRMENQIQLRIKKLVDILGKEQLKKTIYQSLQSKGRFRRLCLRLCHPDKVGANKETAAMNFHEVSQLTAYLQILLPDNFSCALQFFYNRHEEWRSKHTLPPQSNEECPPEVDRKTNPEHSQQIPHFGSQDDACDEVKSRDLVRVIHNTQGCSDNGRLSSLQSHVSDNIEVPSGRPRRASAKKALDLFKCIASGNNDVLESSPKQQACNTTGVKRKPSPCRSTKRAKARIKNPKCELAHYKEKNQDILEHESKDQSTIESATKNVAECDHSKMDKSTRHVYIRRTQAWSSDLSTLHSRTQKRIEHIRSYLRYVTPVGEAWTVLKKSQHGDGQIKNQYIVQSHVVLTSYEPNPDKYCKMGKRRGEERRPGEIFVKTWFTGHSIQTEKQVKMIATRAGLRMRSTNP